MRHPVIATVAVSLVFVVGCSDRNQESGSSGFGGADGVSESAGEDSDLRDAADSEPADDSGNTTDSTDVSTDTADGMDTGGVDLGDPSEDPSCTDKDGDGFYGNCAAGRDCHDGNADVNPDAEEKCGDKLDNDCSGGRDNGCPCENEGSTRPCYAGPAGTLANGACSAGQQTCQNGTWSSCSDQQLPRAETCNGADDDCDGKLDEGVRNPCGTCGEVDASEQCGDGFDNDCDGRVDESCQCGPKKECYGGPPDTLGVGACEAGTRRCEEEFWGTCSGDVTPVAETCGDDIDNDCDGEVDENCTCSPQPEVCDGVDNDCDGEVDEGCTPCLSRSGGSSSKPWEIHKGRGPTCWNQKFSKHGAKGEYKNASIPSPNDSGWMAAPNKRISFDERSTMCGKPGEPDKCECRKGGDFTYFQTFFDIPSTVNINSLIVTIENVDDGVRITVFNKDYPSGKTAPGSYAFLGGGSTSDLAQYLATGRNRIVLTHVDDCCKTRRIEDVRVKLNGDEIKRCE